MKNKSLLERGLFKQRIVANHYITTSMVEIILRLCLWHFKAEEIGKNARNLRALRSVISYGDHLTTQLNIIKELIRESLLNKVHLFTIISKY